MRVAIKSAFIFGAIAAVAASASSIQAAGRAENAPSIVADLTNKQLLLRLGDSVVQTYYFAHGQERYPTPTGSFTIRKLTWNPSWTPPPVAKWAKNAKAKRPGEPGNPMKVVKIFFKEPDYYIHGTDDVESIGTAASHGCLRMDPDEVMEVGKWVMENGGQMQSDNWFWRIIHSRNEEKVVNLSQPIPITVMP